MVINVFMTAYFTTKVQLKRMASYWFYTNRNCMKMNGVIENPGCLIFTFPNEPSNIQYYSNLFIEKIL